MISHALMTALLHGMRPSIGKSLSLAVTPGEESITLRGPAFYDIVNLGPDPVHVIMLADSSTDSATTSDYVLSPIGSGDKCRHEVFVSSADKDNMRDVDNVLHAITAAGKSATLSITRVSVV